MPLVVLFAVACSVAPAPALAQAEGVDDPAGLRARIRAAADRIRSAGLRAGGQLDLNRDFALIALALGPFGDEEDFWGGAEEARTDKQLGSTAGSAGSTSLVALGGVPAILALAVENGALTRTDSGTTVTFRGSPVGIVRVLAGGGYLDTYDPGDPAVALLERITFGVSFDTTRGTLGGDPRLVGDRQQLSEASLRVSVLDRRDPRQLRYAPAWTRFATEVQTALSGAQLTFMTAAVRDAQLGTWLAAANARIASAPPDAIESAIADELRTLRTLALGTETRAAVARITAAYDRFFAERGAMLARAARGAQVVLDYAAVRPVDAPASSRVRLVASVGGAVTATGNASVTFFHGDRTAAVSGRVRDAQLAGQIDLPLRVPDAPPFTLSVAGRYEHLVSDALAAGAIPVPGTSGGIGVLQVKLTIPVRGTAIRLPVSFSVANRTELLREREIRGNVGFTYDLDALFARLKPY